MYIYAHVFVSDRAVGRLHDVRQVRRAAPERPPEAGPQGLSGLLVIPLFITTATVTATILSTKTDIVTTKTAIITTITTTITIVNYYYGHLYYYSY